MTGHCAGRNFSFTSKALGAGRSPWNAAGLSGAQPCGAHLITLGENRDHPASFCSPSTRKQHPGKHSLTEAAIQEQTWLTECRKNVFLKHSKHITKTVTMLMLLAFFFKRHPPLSLYYPAPLCHCSGVPKAPHMLPAPAPHKHNSIPAGWSKPAHKQAPFIMQLSKPSQGQLSFTTTSPARLCCGQEPEPYHAPWPDGRAAPRSTHLF